MTAPRTCRACGAELHGDVRWCLQCYEPARELTPRRAVWAPGVFVDNPIHTRGAVPHWSRWERSATTLGPTGRVVATVVFLSTVSMALSAGGFLYVLLFPVTASVVLPAIWARGWIVPGDDARDIRRATVPRTDPHPGAPITKAMLVWRCVWMAGVVVACWIFAYSPSVAAKAAVLGLATVTAVVLFWRSFFVR
jgi:hypothetical protein